MTKRLFTATLLLFFLAEAGAQNVLSLDSCRALALRNNKQLQAARLQQDVALNTRKAVRTKYLPKVDAIGGYEYTSREISILNDKQKSALSGMGTTVASQLGGNVSTVLQDLVSRGLISPDVAQQMGALAQQAGSALADGGNALGGKIVDAFRTDTRNMWAGSIALRQPIYMGGAITAANKMADISQQMAADQLSLTTQNTLYGIDEAYWLVVSLRQKQKLAQSFRDLVQKLDDDVHKMIQEGVATRADGLKVDVKVNEAEMALLQAEDGLQLSRMLLCQLCGLPMDSDITLTDENADDLSAFTSQLSTLNAQSTPNRPEVAMLSHAVELSRQSTKLARAEYLPHVALTAGYLVSNPNVFNGFQRRFSGVWNVGVLVQVPLWNWGEGVYKVRATKAATAIAQTELNDIQEKIDLQVAQSQFKVKEAQKRCLTARQNMASAEENLRCANLGFREGVMETTDVMAAQTAWLQAHTQKIDAEIDLRLSLVGLQKALGTLTY